MSSTEFYPDGQKVTKFVSGPVAEMAEKFGNLSNQAFLNGAERVEQKIINGNETCPKCDSGLRFDQCCGPKIFS